jgi:hypothetical protein
MARVFPAAPFGAKLRSKTALICLVLANTSNSSLTKLDNLILFRAIDQIT